MKYGKYYADTDQSCSIKDLAEMGAHNCGSGGRWFESTQLYQSIKTQTGLLFRVRPLGMAAAENRWTADPDERRLVGAAPRFTPALP
jgi:hypothetical protein